MFSVRRNIKAFVMKYCRISMKESLHNHITNEKVFKIVDQTELLLFKSCLAQ